LPELQTFVSGFPCGCGGSGSRCIQPLSPCSDFGCSQLKQSASSLFSHDACNYLTARQRSPDTSSTLVRLTTRPPSPGSTTQGWKGRLQQTSVGFHHPCGDYTETVTEGAGNFYSVWAEGESYVGSGDVYYAKD